MILQSPDDELPPPPVIAVVCMRVGVAQEISRSEVFALVLCPEIRAIVVPIIVIGTIYVAYHIADVVNEAPFVTVLPLMVSM